MGPASTYVGSLVQGVRVEGAKGRDLGFIEEDSDSSKKVLVIIILLCYANNICCNIIM